MTDGGVNHSRPQSIGNTGLSDADSVVSQEVTVANKEGLHARPVMRFVDVASTFSASISVFNQSGRNERVDGKSAMEMMLLEAVQGSVLRIEAKGCDARSAVEALSSLVESGFSDGSSAEAGSP